MPLTLLMDTEDIWHKLGFFALLVGSLALHEFGHAYSALKLGDRTAKDLGRVTINPLPHLDPIFSVVLPLAMLFSGTGLLFGAGKPVPVNDRNLKRPALDLMLISVAGPAMNIVLALLLTGAFHVYCTVRDVDPVFVLDRDKAVILFLDGIRLNFILAIFNLLPVPPLDGHRVLGFFMPRAMREQFYRMSFLGLLLLVPLLFGGGWHYIDQYVLQPLSDFYYGFMPGGGMRLF